MSEGRISSDIACNAAAAPADLGTMTAEARSLLADAEWLAHRYAENDDQIQFRHVPRARHREVTFITDEYLGPAGRTIAMPRQEALAVTAAAAPVHFVFHSAFCCSTLVVRALDLEGLAMGLKEPVILNDIAGWHSRGAERTKVMAALDSALRLLARPFAAGEAVVIKPSNVTSALAPAMMMVRPDARALLLHAPLPVFLGSVARKGLEGRLWVRELLMKLIRASLVDLGFSNEDYFRLTDLQAAAVAWLAQQALFHRMAGQFGAGRVRSLDSETLLADPQRTMAALCRHFALAADADQLNAMMTGPAFATHSKSGAAFGRTQRLAEAASGEAAHADEIAKVATWAAAVAANAGVELVLPSPLLD
jgi:hypothetical protein